MRPQRVFFVVAVVVLGAVVQAQVRIKADYDPKDVLSIEGLVSVFDELDEAAESKEESVWAVESHEKDTVRLRCSLSKVGAYRTSQQPAIRAKLRKSLKGRLLWIEWDLASRPDVEVLESDEFLVVFKQEPVFFVHRYGVPFSIDSSKEFDHFLELTDEFDLRFGQKAVARSPVELKIGKDWTRRLLGTVERFTGSRVFGESQLLLELDYKLGESFNRLPFDAEGRFLPLVANVVTKDTDFVDAAERHRGPIQLLVHVSDVRFDPGIRESDVLELNIEHADKRRKRASDSGPDNVREFPLHLASGSVTLVFDAIREVRLPAPVRPVPEPAQPEPVKVKRPSAIGSAEGFCPLDRFDSSPRQPLTETSLLERLGQLEKERPAVPRRIRERRKQAEEELAELPDSVTVAQWHALGSVQAREAAAGRLADDWFAIERRLGLPPLVELVLSVADEGEASKVLELEPPATLERWTSHDIRSKREGLEVLVVADVRHGRQEAEVADDLEWIQLVGRREAELLALLVESDVRSLIVEGLSNDLFHADENANACLAIVSGLWKSVVPPEQVGPLTGGQLEVLAHFGAPIVYAATHPGVSLYAAYSDSEAASLAGARAYAQRYVLAKQRFYRKLAGPGGYEPELGFDEIQRRVYRRALTERLTQVYAYQQEEKLENAILLLTRAPQVFDREDFLEYEVRDEMLGDIAKFGMDSSVSHFALSSTMARQLADRGLKRRSARSRVKVEPPSMVAVEWPALRAAIQFRAGLDPREFARPIPEVTLAILKTRESIPLEWFDWLPEEGQLAMLRRWSAVEYDESRFQLEEVKGGPFDTNTEGTSLAEHLRKKARTRKVSDRIELKFGN